MAYLDISAVVSDKDGALTFFIVNRHPDESIELDLSLQGFTHQRIIMDKVMSGHALDAKNGPEAEPVAPKDGQGAAVTQQKLTAALFYELSHDSTWGVIPQVLPFNTG